MWTTSASCSIRLTSLVSGSVTLVGTLAFMISTNFWLTLVTMAFVPVFAKAAASPKHSRKYYVAQQSALGAVNGYIQESVSGQKVVKVFNHEETCVEEFNLLNDDMRDKQFNAQFYGGIMGPVMGNTSEIIVFADGGRRRTCCACTPGSTSADCRFLPGMRGIFRCRST